MPEQPAQARVASAANPHFSDWWDGVGADVTAALERAAGHLDDPFAESIASVGCDIAHEAFCTGWEAGTTNAYGGQDVKLMFGAARHAERQMLRERILACQVIVTFPFVDGQAAAVLVSDLLAILTDGGS